VRIEKIRYPDEANLVGVLLRSGVPVMSNGGKYTVILGAAVLALSCVETVFAETSYGSQLMSPAEWSEHRATMRSLSPPEREAYRAQHHEAMQKRAESMGLSLPDQPPMYGQGFGRAWPGYGYGRGGPRYWGPGYGNWGSPPWVRQTPR